MGANNVREWYASLSDRERVLVIGGGAAALLLSATLLIRPLLSSNEVLKGQITQRQHDLRWMQQAAAEVKLLRGSVPLADTTQPLQLRVSTAAQQARLTPERVQSRDADRVQIWLENAPFDALLRLLEKLSAQGAVVEKASIKAAKTPSQVDAQLTIANR